MDDEWMAEQIGGIREDVGTIKSDVKQLNGMVNRVTNLEIWKGNHEGQHTATRRNVGIILALGGLLLTSLLLITGGVPA